MDESTRRALGVLLRETREVRHWRQHDLAEATGFSVRTIGTYEREGPPDRVVDTLDAALGGELRVLAAQADIALPAPRLRPRVASGVAPMTPPGMTRLQERPFIDPFSVPAPPSLVEHDERALDERGSVALAEFLRTQMARTGISSSHELGKALGIAQGTAHRLLTSQGVPREETLARIARWAQCSITQIRELARRASGEATPFRVPREFDQLNSRERAALVEVGWVMLAAHGERVTR